MTSLIWYHYKQADYKQVDYKQVDYKQVDYKRVDYKQVDSCISKTWTTWKLEYHTLWNDTMWNIMKCKHWIFNDLKGSMPSIFYNLRRIKQKHIILF